MVTTRLQWERTIKATQKYINSRPGWGATPIVAIEAFNEPDFWQGEGSLADFNNLIARLKTYPEFHNTEFPAASTLNSNNARWWYDQIPRATQGSSHLLGGTMNSYVNFMEYVKSTGKEFVNPELHSLGEAIIGAEHGMTSGVWWADALRARGLFVQASDGKRLGYHEDLQRQSAAAVYRAPDGEVYAFAGGSSVSARRPPTALLVTKTSGSTASASVSTFSRQSSTSSLPTTLPTLLGTARGLTKAPTLTSTPMAPACRRSMVIGGRSSTPRRGA